MSGYYDQEFDPWVRGIRNIGTMILQMPQLRAQARDNAMRQQLYGAQMQSESAQAENFRANSRKLDAETASIQDENSGEKRLGDALRRVTSNPSDTNAIGDVFSEYGRYFKNHPQDAAQGLGTLLQEFQALQKGDRVQMFSASTGKTVGPNEIVGTGADARGNIVANRGQLVGTPMGDKIMAGVPVPTVMRPGTTAVAPEGSGQFTEVAKGPPLPPHSAGADVIRNRLISQALLKDAELGTSNTTNVLQRFDQMTKDPIDVQASVQPVNDELVPVINPKGVPVRIRKSQLADALAQGYKQR